MTSDTINLTCPAKLNLALSVGAPDGGFGGLHPIASWMVALAFADRLKLTRTNVQPSRFSIAFEQDPTAARVDWPLDQDLAYRAHALLTEHVGAPLPIDLALKKRIPAGAGLGGGSSNAAGVLVGLNRLFELGLDEPALRTIGTRLGSDVPFLIGALLGRPAAVVTGAGDRIESVPMGLTLHIVLIFPPFGCSTSQVYRGFDELAGPDQRVNLSPVRALAASRPVNPDALFNDLAAAAGRVEPKLAALHRELTTKMARPVQVSGSGSTLFLLAPDAPAGRELARQVTAWTGLPAVATRTM